MINLFINPYEEKRPERKAELEFCMDNNMANGHIGKIYQLDGRPTFQDFFNYINSVTTDNDVNIITNLDIYFDDTIKLAEQIKSNECYALSRWDVTSITPFTILMYDQAGSQDTWIFRGKVRDGMYADYPCGKMGCDNRLAHELQHVAKYMTINPCRDIRCIHYHLSQQKNYDTQIRNKNTVVQPPYAFVKATHLPTQVV